MKYSQVFYRGENTFEQEKEVGKVLNIYTVGKEDITNSLEINRIVRSYIANRVNKGYTIRLLMGESFRRSVYTEVLEEYEAEVYNKKYWEDVYREVQRVYEKMYEGFNNNVIKERHLLIIDVYEESEVPILYRKKMYNMLREIEEYGQQSYIEVVFVTKQKMISEELEWENNNGEGLDSIDYIGVGKITVGG